MAAFRRTHAHGAGESIATARQACPFSPPLEVVVLLVAFEILQGGKPAHSPAQRPERQHHRLPGGGDRPRWTQTAVPGVVVVVVAAPVSRAHHAQSGSGQRPPGGAAGAGGAGVPSGARWASFWDWGADLLSSCVAGAAGRALAGPVRGHARAACDTARVPVAPGEAAGLSCRPEDEIPAVKQVRFAACALAGCLMLSLTSRTAFCPGRPTRRTKEPSCGSSPSVGRRRLN